MTPYATKSADLMVALNIEWKFKAQAALSGVAAPSRQLGWSRPGPGLFPGSVLNSPERMGVHVGSVAPALKHRTWRDTQFNSKAMSAG